MQSIKRQALKQSPGVFPIWSWASAFLIFSLLSLLFHGFYPTLIALVVGVLFLGLHHFFRLIGWSQLPAIQGAFLILIGLSIIPPEYQKTAALVFIMCVVAWSCRQWKQTRNLVPFYWQLLSGLRIRDAVAWQVLLILIPIMGVNTDWGFSARDLLHPLSEAALGHSFERSLIGVPDLSYSGHEIRTHFLSSRVSLFLARVTGVDLFNTVFFTTVFIGFIASFLVVTQSLKHLSLSLPIFFLFLFPVFGFVDFPVIFSPFSYLSAFVLSAPIIIYLAKKRNTLAYVSVAPLVLIKAGYFLTFSGGILIYLLIIKDWRKLSLMSLLLFLLFGIAYFTFLSGSHSHNLWIIFPSYVYKLCADMFSSRGYALYPSVDTLIVILFIGVQVVAIYFSVFRNKSDETLRAAGAITLSALLGVTLLTEVSEENHTQFLRAALLPGAIILWSLLIMFSRRISSTSRILLWGFVCFQIIFCNIPEWKSFGQYGVRALLASSATIRDKFYEVIPEKNPRLLGITQDFFDVYQWMGRKLPTDSIVVFGRHYSGVRWSVFPTRMYSEHYYFSFPETDRFWWPHSQFYRSALSGLQFYSESFKYRGLAMEPDFPRRLAETIYLYRRYVESSSESKKQLDQFYAPNFGIQKALPLSQQTGVIPLLQHKLSGGREWYWGNRRFQVYSQTRKELEKLTKEAKVDWLRHFLVENGITHIMLENGDKAVETLERITDIIYRQGQLSVLEVHTNR